MSPSTRRAWIEIPLGKILREQVPGSPSTRRAWIEIIVSRACAQKIIVALHSEGVDRNFEGDGEPEVEDSVALHSEGVDRNDGG